MKNIKLFIAIIIFYCLQYSYSETTTVVLQYGLEGYTRCEDSYNFTEELEVNHSTDIEVHTFNCIP